MSCSTQRGLCLLLRGGCERDAALNICGRMIKTLLSTLSLAEVTLAVETPFEFSAKEIDVFNLLKFRVYMS